MERTRKWASVAGMIFLRPEPLTAEKFAPFGQVISPHSGGGKDANQGTAVRFDRVAALSNSRPGATPNLAVFRATPQPLPLELKLLERHPHSSQTFLPLKCARYLIVVAPPGADGGPDTEKVRAFLCGPHEGINYLAGTWHHPIVVLDAPAEFAMLIWEDGTGGDCEERPLGPFARVEDPGPAR